MRKGRFLVLAVLVAAAWLAGCDSTEEGQTDAERILGAWSVVRLQDATGDQTQAFQARGRMDVTYTADSYTLVFDAVDDANDTVLQGDFALDERTGQVTMVGTVLGFNVTLTAAYAFPQEDVLELRVSNEVLQGLNLALGTEYVGPATLTLERQ